MPNSAQIQLFEAYPVQLDANRQNKKTSPKTSKLKVFSKPLTPRTLIDRTAFCTQRASDKDLISAYQYAMFGNALIRYHNLRYYPWVGNDNTYMIQRCGDDAIKRIICELEERSIFDEADSSYTIDFTALKKNSERAKKQSGN